MAVFIFATVSWNISAHKWFIGPVKTIDDSDPTVVTDYEKQY
jgi:hypothetical protein